MRVKINSIIMGLKIIVSVKVWKITLGSNFILIKLIKNKKIKK